MIAKLTRSISLPLLGLLMFAGCASLMGDDRVLIADDPSPRTTSKPTEQKPTKTEIETETKTEIDIRQAPDSEQPVEQRIFEIVNERRTEAGLAPLDYDENLAAVAAAHSQDMIERNFYAHNDPDGVTPNDRVTTALSDWYYLVGTSENIAYRSGGIGPDQPAELADAFMVGWMNSPGHRENILQESSTHVGVGVVHDGNRTYATQKFMSYTVRAQPSPQEQIEQSGTNEIRFIVGSQEIPRDRLDIAISLPDESAQWRDAEGRVYTGVKYADPEWLNDTELSVSLPVDDYGSGTYQLRFGTFGDRRIMRTAMPVVVE